MRLAALMLRCMAADICSLECSFSSTTVLPEGLRVRLRAIQSTKRKPWVGTGSPNGELLTAAEEAGFEVLLTTDKNLRYQQNLTERKIAVVVLGKARWRLIRPLIPEVVAAVSAAKPGTCTEVEIPD